jgi:pyruvate,orthophosphate dikinase
MVFGNLGDHSATGVAFTRDAGTGEDLFNGEFLVNAQGEDVVAGIRTPQQVSLDRLAPLGAAGARERGRARREVPVAGRADARPVPAAAARRDHAGEPLHRHAGPGVHHPGRPKLWMLQTRNGKRTGAAMVRIAMEMLQQGMIDEKTALLRVVPDRLNDLLHPIFDPAALKRRHRHRARPAGVARRGQRADRVPCRRGRDLGQGRARTVILVRQETSPEDLRGMSVARASSPRAAA